MKIIWTDSAEDDLVELGTYITRETPVRAKSFVQEIIQAGNAIADMPRAFALVPQLEHKGIRKRVIGRYLILYRIVSDKIEIIHVVHGARDYIRALFPDD